MHDGQWVSYSGAPGDLTPGDEGTVLATEPTYVHVMWRTGALAGQVTPQAHEDLDLVVLPGMSHGSRHIEASLDDSLEVEARNFVVSARDVYDSAGPTGVLERMSFAGYLSDLRDVAEEGFAFVASRVRSSPYMQQIAAQLDEGEVETLVQTTTATLLREFISSDE